MKYRSVFDIIGPVMIGPSSSHTAGAVRIGRLARSLFGMFPKKATIHLYGSFAKTHRGHATDVAILAGILGLDTNDTRIPHAFELAKQMGVDFQFIIEEAIPVHPNTALVVLENGENRICVEGISIGGGMVQITQVDDFELHLSGDSPALLIFHQDAYGAIAAVTQLLAKDAVNISHMEVSRSEKGRRALMLIETDQVVSSDTLDAIAGQAHIQKIIKLDV